MCWKSISLTTIGLVLGFAAVVVGDKIQNCKTTDQMLWTIALSIVLLAAAIIAVAIATLIDQSEMARKESQKVKRVPTHNNAWRGDC